MSVFQTIKELLGFPKPIPSCACGAISTHIDNNDGTYRCIRCAYKTELFVYKTPGLCPPDKAAGLLDEYEQLRRELN